MSSLKALKQETIKPKQFDVEVEYNTTLQNNFVSISISALPISKQGKCYWKKYCKKHCAKKFHLISSGQLTYSLCHYSN